MKLLLSFRLALEKEILIQTLSLLSLFLGQQVVVCVCFQVSAHSVFFRLFMCPLVFICSLVVSHLDMQAHAFEQVTCKNSKIRV